MQNAPPPTEKKPDMPPDKRQRRQRPAAIADREAEHWSVEWDQGWEGYEEIFARYVNIFLDLMALTYLTA